MNALKNKPVILFDGFCNLCSSTVKFIIKHDKKAQFLFASQQSDAGKKILLQISAKKVKSESILLIDNQQIYKESTAALRILRALGGLYAVCYVFIIIPPILRNALYKIIAKNRYKWFGKRTTCLVPTPELKKRFIT